MTSQASQRGRASLQGSVSRAAANTGGGAMPGQVPTDRGVGNVRRTIPRNDTPPGYRRINDYKTSMLGGRRRSVEGPRAFDASTPVVARGGDMAGVRRYERTKNQAYPAPHTNVELANSAGHSSRLAVRRGVEARVGPNAASLAGRLGPHPSLADYGATDLSLRARDGSTVGGPRCGTNAASLASRLGPHPSLADHDVINSSF